MLDRIDHVIDLMFQAKKDKKTFILSIGCLVAFGVSVGAVAVYERILRELEVDSGHVHTHANRPYYPEDDEDDY